MFRARALGEKQTPADGEKAPSVDAEGPEDFWENESFEVLGQVSSYALPIFVVLALVIGLFASSTYNNDADVFLDSPRSADDTAKLYTFEN